MLRPSGRYVQGRHLSPADVKGARGMPWRTI